MDALSIVTPAACGELHPATGAPCDMPATHTAADRFEPHSDTAGYAWPVLDLPPYMEGLTVADPYGFTLTRHTSPADPSAPIVLLAMSEDGGTSVTVDVPPAAWARISAPVNHADYSERLADALMAALPDILPAEYRAEILAACQTVEAEMHPEE